MKKPVRFFIYLGILALTWFILSPALSINTNQIGAPVRELTQGWSALTFAGAIMAVALLATYAITSGWGLIVLGVLAFLGLMLMAVMHPHLLPLLIPLSALWFACAVARRREPEEKKPATE